MTEIKPGEYVVWKWAGSFAHGQVMEVHESRLEIESKGSRIVRNGTADNPAILIRQQNGTEVLKLASELQKAHENKQ